MSTPQQHPQQPEQEVRDRVIQGHSYDGIREYDNPMPGWWLWIFYATIAFSLVYVVGMHVFGVINTYEKDLAANTQRIESMRTSTAAAAPAFDASEESLAKIAEDAAAAQAGAANFATYCASCHGDKGQGLIGPNLTDDAWLHGASHTDIYKVLEEGVASKGMPAWSGVLTPQQRAEVIAFIRSIHGSNPPGAKAPEGTEATI